MFRATGVGQIEAHLDFSYVGVIKALLYNFDFDDFYGHKLRPLKDAHKKFLIEHVVPLLANHRGQIWMQGSASRIGEAGWNMTLSQERVIRVAGFLTLNGVTGDQIQTDAIGNELTAKHALDDPRDRGVMLWVYPKFKFDDPPPPRHVPPRKHISR